MPQNTGGHGARPELVIALVGPAGVRLEAASKEVKEHLKDFGYSCEEISLSGLLKNFVGWRDASDSSEFARILHAQEMGFELRKAAKHGGVLALAAMAKIREHRRGITGDPGAPAPSQAYILSQLKHPDEVDLLRRAYGDSFHLIGGHAPRIVRLKQLSERLAKSENQPGDPRYNEKAEKIIEDDSKQEHDLGQNTRDTYPKSDLFVDLSISSGANSIHRYLDLVFGHPFHTPTPDEFSMYQASSVALRSSDKNRQVGAVVVNLEVNSAHRVTSADVVAMGMNEVPKGGGGFYWDGDSPDGRDQYLLAYHGEDRADEIKKSALAEMISRIAEEGWLNSPQKDKKPRQLADELLPKLRKTQFMNIGEFMRPVHAEMAALLDSAKRGVPVNDRTMFVTTFPCHNCAKHIIAAGIKRVVYLEPYPKSRAGYLHDEELLLDATTNARVEGRVVFSAFSGVAPRKYRQLFEMSERGEARGITLSKWSSLRPSLLPSHVHLNADAAYLRSECQLLEGLNVNIYRWDKATLCPM